MDGEEREEKPWERFRRCWFAWAENPGSVGAEDVEWLRHYVGLDAGLGYLDSMANTRRERRLFLDWLGVEEAV